MNGLCILNVTHKTKIQVLKNRSRSLCKLSLNQKKDKRKGRRKRPSKNWDLFTFKLHSIIYNCRVFGENRSYVLLFLTRQRDKGWKGREKVVAIF